MWVEFVGSLLSSDRFFSSGRLIGDEKVLLTSEIFIGLPYMIEESLPSHLIRVINSLLYLTHCA